MAERLSSMRRKERDAEQGPRQQPQPTLLALRLVPPATTSLASRTQEFQSSKFVTDRDAENPRPQGRLRDDELIGADERAGVRVAEILTVNACVPGILRDAE